ncbi:tyrosine-type recombinase/integrase [Niameybacter massiliensis]|uniref:Tyrosine-type recombinase/integrase n=1 Tax=Holtiella tumoricola TaxID=3018743 RepID=A0AA42DMJ9_9FIRM|nr:tyrosine-type recombinase/integrase [Holtiella tumoricola]MDA3731443.1 tyrosine-type recombinase/integrase [Holtiella tumoricola]
MPKKSIQLKQLSSSNTSQMIESFITNCKVRGLSQSTLYNYEHTSKLFNEVINKNIDNVTSSDIDKFILYLRARGNNNTSIRTRIKSLKAFLSYCNVDVVIPTIKAENSIKTPYTEDEIQLLLKKPTINSYTQWRNHAIVSTFLGTGIRCRTLLNLKIKDIDFNQGTIYLDTTKTGKKYHVPLSTTLKQTLKHYLSLFDHEMESYLFMSLYGEQLTREGLKQTIRDYNLKRGGIKNKCPFVQTYICYKLLTQWWQYSFSPTNFRS